MTDSNEEKRIDSLTDYIDFLEKTKTYNRQGMGLSAHSLFRGQGNNEWTLLPALYRTKLHLFESLLIKEMISLSPSEFYCDKFDALSKMQHYGLPTRLLDVTTNPLTAIYFACSDKNQKSKDGAVYYWNGMPSYNQEMSIVKLIMEYIFNYSDLSSSPCNTIDDIYIHMRENNEVLFDELKIKSVDDLIMQLSIPGVSIIPNNTNNRLEAQNGAFIIFGMKKDGNRLVPYIPKDGNIGIAATKIIIPKEIKSDLLEKLDLLGINEHRLFPDLQHQAGYVTDKIISQNKILF